MSPLPSLRHSPEGASLVELLAAMTTATLLVLAMLEGVSLASDVWQRQIGHLGMEREARAALRLLQDDLRSLAGPPLLATDRPAWPALQVEIPDSPGASSRIAFLCSNPPMLREASAETGGDLHLVLYAVAETPDGGATSAASRSSSPKLLRRRFSAAETYQRLSAHQADGRPIVQQEDWSSLCDAAHDQEAMAHDVVRFVVRPRFLTPKTGKSETRPSHLDLLLRLTHRARTGSRAQKLAANPPGNGTAHANTTPPDDPHDERDIRTYTLCVALP